MPGSAGSQTTILDGYPTRGEARLRRRVAVLLGALAEGYLYLVFDVLLHVLWPEPLLLSGWS